MIEGFDIICISTSNWDKPWGSRQQIMSRLSSENRVLFVEYQSSLLHLLKYPYLINDFLCPRLKVINKNLFVYRPWLNLPFGYYSKFINRLNQYILLFQIKKLLKKLHFNDSVFWTYEPTAVYLLRKLMPRLSVYHCIDFYSDEKNNPLWRATIKGLENRLSKQVNIIFASSQKIFADKKELNENTFLVPSAADSRFLEGIDKVDISNEIKTTSKPLIGIVGTVDHRVDLTLLEKIAEFNRNWSLVIAGDIKSRAFNNILKSNKNIYKLGYKDRLYLHSLLEAMDVCLIPYRIDEFTKAISSVKLYEYLSVGKPVVSTDLPEVKLFSDKGLIKIAKNYTEFIQAIDEVIKNDSPELKKRRIEFAKANTWENRINQISSIIKNFL